MKKLENKPIASKARPEE